MFLNDFYKIFNTLKYCNHSTVSRDFPNVYDAILQYSLQQLLNREITSVQEKNSFRKSLLILWLLKFLEVPI